MSKTLNDFLYSIPGESSYDLTICLFFSPLTKRHMVWSLMSGDFLFIYFSENVVFGDIY